MKLEALIDSILTIAEGISSTLSETVESTQRLPKQVGAITDYNRELVNAILRSPERLDTADKIFTRVSILNIILKQSVRPGNKEQVKRKIRLVIATNRRPWEMGQKCPRLIACTLHSALEQSLFPFFFYTLLFKLSL